MSVQDGPTFKRYVANGVTTTFAIPFLLLDAGDLVVTLDDAPVTSGFTLIGVGDPSSTAIFDVAPTGDLLFRLVITFERLFDYQENGDFLAGTVNDDFDRIWLALKELSRYDTRTLRTSDLEPEGLPDLPSIADRIGKLLSFDAFGNPIAIAADSQSATELAIDLANTLDPAKGAALLGYTGYGASTTVKQVIDQLLHDGLHPSMFGFVAGDDIASLLNTVQYPFDLRGDSFTLSDGVTRTASLFNGELTYGGALPGTLLSGIVEFAESEDMDGRRLHVIYTGGASGVRGIVARNSAHGLILRWAYAEGTTDQGIRVQGSDDVDLSYAGAYDCMKDAVTDPVDEKAYGAIAVFGGSAVSNRTKLKNLYVRTQSTGISVAYGSGHEITNCDAAPIDPLTVSSVSMGIYCIGKLVNLSIENNDVGKFANEGIDVHNTGSSAEDGVQAIFIKNNRVSGASYVQISVVASDDHKIQDCEISGNIVRNDPDGRTFGYSGGIVVENVISPTIKSNKCWSEGVTPSPQSYGLQVSKCSYPVVSDNFYSGPWNRYEFFSGYINSIVRGSHGSAVPAGSIGILFDQTVANAVQQITGVRLTGVDATAKVLQQSGTSLALTFFSMTACHINGRVELNDIASGIIFNNFFRNFSGAINAGADVTAAMNPGWQNPLAGTTKATPGSVNQWLPYRLGGTTHYIPMYLNTTN